MKPCCMISKLRVPLKAYGKPTTQLMTSSHFHWLKTTYQNKYELFICRHVCFQDCAAWCHGKLSKWFFTVSGRSLQMTLQSTQFLCLCMFVFMQAAYCFKNHFLIRINVLHNYLNWSMVIVVTTGCVCFEAFWIYLRKMLGLCNKCIFVAPLAGELPRGRLVGSVVALLLAQCVGVRDGSRVAPSTSSPSWCRSSGTVKPQRLCCAGGQRLVSRLLG